MLRAMGAAIHHATGFMPVTDDTAATMRTLWGEGMNGAFKTVEVMRNSIHHNFERFIVLISAHFAGLNPGMKFCSLVRRTLGLH